MTDGGLAIHNNPTSERGKYLLMKFNFSKVKSTAEEVQKSFNDVCMAAVKDFVEKYSFLLPEDTLECFLAETGQHSDGT